MTPPRNHDKFADDVGAYLLGALEPDEARRFEKHLKGCSECRQEMARLEVARDAIPASVEQFAPSPDLKASLMATVRIEAAERAAADRSPSRERATPSRWRGLFLARPRFAAAAAAVVIALGVAAGALVGTLGGDGSGEAGGSDTIAATVDSNRMPAAKASLVVPHDRDANDGAILRVEGMQAPRTGHVYEVWIQRGKRIEPSSLFTVGSDGSGAAAIPERVRGADAVLVTQEPEGGSKKPTGRTIMRASLSS